MLMHMIIFVFVVTSAAAFLSNSKSLCNGQCLENQYGTYRVTLQFCDGMNWRIFRAGERSKRRGRVKINTPLGTSCLDIKRKGLSRGDGKYMIDPDGDGNGKAFEAYCDMKSFGGGWTMCYTTDSHVNIKTELKTTPAHGYRADCRNILFSGVMFVDEKSKQKAAFTKTGPAVTFTGNYDKQANAFGLWTAQGVAPTQYKYQMLICDTSFYKGLHFSGFYKSCYKKCNNWCSDTTSSYFRTSQVSGSDYNGVAFNENGHKPRPNRLISVGIR